jgi:hypothetical protein
MTLIPELERELRSMAARRRRRRIRWFAGLAPVVVVTGTTAALAAGGVIPIGSPAQDPGAGQRKPDVGWGVVVPGTDRVLGVQVPDPDGGPPWGLRIVSTTRGLGCLQFGRLVDGRIGALGRDGAFKNDGRFHPFAADALLGPADCASLDANGRLFTNVVAGNVAASASLLGGCHPRKFTRGVPESSYCDERSLRMLYYGTLGPEAASITAAGETIPTVGPEGAYLIVTRPSNERLNGFAASEFPMNGPITQIAFKDGTTCKLGRTGPTPRDSCRLPGYVPKPVPNLTEADLAAPVSARRVRRGKWWRIEIRFKARVAITDASAAYNVRISSPQGRQRGRYAVGVTSRNIAAGETIVQRFTHQRGHGVYRGTVTYNRAAAPGQMPMGPNGIKVGEFSVRLP